MIAALTDRRTDALDCERLLDVIVRCGHMLKVGLSRGSPSALQITQSMAAGCCELLKEAAQRNPQFVATVAQHTATWPVMIAMKESYHRDADQYLRGIRVGTKSAPCTSAGTHVNAAESPSSKLATMILGKLLLYNGILRRRAAWGQGSVRLAGQKLRTEAMGFREILKLPALDKSSQREWWEIGKRILNDYWTQHPDEARKDIAFLGAGRREHKSDRTQAIGLVRRAFYTAVKLIS